VTSVNTLHNAHRQATSQASTNSAWRNPVCLSHSSLGFQRPVGRRSCTLTPQATIGRSAIMACMNNFPLFAQLAIFMAVLSNRAGRFSSCGFFLLSSSSIFFPRLISAVADWMSTILRHMVCLSAHLECRSETCCARLAGNAGPKKSPKSPIWTPSRTFVGLYLRN